ncbi:BTAD domain-containing putative transcriptional regulator [Streptomyces sp. YIM 130001]|uniref:BTAD domain-containing putative transcriptional regulator n=1 Tax=Streptomyces sp. YIM 130001 TaxID=2259644 RepID=UPI001F08ACE1|nr:BTAD domain-containing putative transcriptional regulator [Streptomyces sp. YIM 130001]
MQIYVLGSAQAVDDQGQAVPLGPRLRALLTVLALRAGRAVSVEYLVGEVWESDPPADATAALQALVGRLRRAVGHAVVASEDGGYRLAVPPDQVDVHRFERLVADGGRALADGDAEKAGGLLDEALGLWRGPALADLPDRTADLARLEALRLTARRTRIEAGLALGRAEQALPELTALTGAHPLDEPLHALHLRALRDAGRPAEALAAYEDVRTTLADRLGADPGPELRALHTELLTSQAPAARPPHRPEPAPAPSVTGNLRARVTSFVGREADIEAIRGDLGRSRLVTLLGPGGAGKTRLSQEAAESLATGTVPDGVWLAELAPVDATGDPDAVPEAVLAAIGGRETVLHGAGADEMRAADPHAADPLMRLTAHCASRRMLILLDNCEHVVDAAARLVEELLARCPGVTVLATSREPLGVPGESVRALEPLPEPVALRLLAERGAAARAGFRVEDDPEAAAEICTRLDGLPLAIELAAARLRSLTPRQIADRLDDRFRLLTSGSRTVLPRQQTLRAVVDWSWDLLDATERAALRRFSVFAGGCDLSAAEAVCSGAPVGDAPTPLDAAAVLGVLGSLVDKSLVVAAAGTRGEMRYRLLETVGEYAGERLDEAGDRAAAERAHLVHYRELVRTSDFELRGPGQRAAIRRIEEDYENLRTAMRRALAAGDEDEALCLVHALGWYWWMQDLRSESRYWAGQAAELGPDPFAEPVRPAEPLFERCTQEPPPFRPEVRAEARRGAHLMALATMDPSSESWSSEESLARLRAVTRSYLPGQPQTCRMPGWLWVFAVMLTGEPIGIRELADITVDACRRHGFRWELASALQMRANVSANSVAWGGDANADADASLALYTELGDLWGAAEAHSARGEAHENRGDFDAAGADFRAAIDHMERLGAGAQVAVLRVRFASTLLERGRTDEGERLIREVLDAPGQNSEALSMSRLYLAKWLGRTGRTEEARALMRQMRSQFVSGPAALFQGVAYGLLGWLDTLDGHYEEALVSLRIALESGLQQVSMTVAPQLPPSHLVTAARALGGSADPGRAAEGVRLLGAADAHLPDRHVRSPEERENREATEAVLRATLDEETYARAYAQGGGLSIEEAAALV